MTQVKANCSNQLRWLESQSWLTQSTKYGWLTQGILPHIHHQLYDYQFFIVITSGGNVAHQT